MTSNNFNTSFVVTLLESAISEVLFFSACHVLDLYGVLIYGRELSTIEEVLIHTVMKVALNLYNDGYRLSDFYVEDPFSDFTAHQIKW